MALLIVAALSAACGCTPPTPTQYDPEALLAAKKVVILPLTDAPGPAGKNAGKAVAGAVLGQFIKVGGRYTIINVPEDQLRIAAQDEDFVLEDCYDPAVAAAIGRRLGADMVVAGDLPHFGTQQEMSTTAVLVVAGGGTNTTHWVSLDLRLVRCCDGKVLYTGSGTASSPQGYARAAADAAAQATAALKFLLEQEKQKQTQK